MGKVLFNEWRVKSHNQGKNYVYFVQPYKIVRLVIIHLITLVIIWKPLFSNVHCNGQTWFSKVTLSIN